MDRKSFVRALAALLITCWIVSLLLPALPASDAPGLAPGWVVIIFGWLAAFSYQFGWFANFFIVGCTAWMLIVGEGIPSRRLMHLLLTPFALLMANAAIGYPFEHLFWVGSDVGPGFFAWFVSGFGTLIAMVVSSAHLQARSDD
ncbi:MAG: hypothetical protein BVN33_00515 [Proteobacteria bacterium ST_bin13]|nr:MAG: hypothetical protein BVN33_00515 [Proteobacteria bacterium ST_bin13]